MVLSFKLQSLVTQVTVFAAYKEWSSATCYSDISYQFVSAAAGGTVM